MKFVAKRLSRLWIVLPLLAVLAQPAAALRFPSISIHVTNPPGQEYYLDLLLRNHKSPDLPTHGDPYGSDITYREDMVALLRSYEQEGWYATYFYSGKDDFNGQLTAADYQVLQNGEPANDHYFSGYDAGMPEAFRIILVTSHGEVRVTPAIRTNGRTELRVLYDWASGKASIPDLSQAPWVYAVFALAVLLAPRLFVRYIMRLPLRPAVPFLLAINLPCAALLSLILHLALFPLGLAKTLFLTLPVVPLSYVAEVVYIRIRKPDDTRAQMAAAFAGAALCAVLLVVLLPALYNHFTGTHPQKMIRQYDT
ncbi:hypothetical protein LI291_02155 [Intestinibacillus massiliensis]|nr:hypothetical protein [Intestinibacillus massiliensis]